MMPLVARLRSLSKASFSLGGRKDLEYLTHNLGLLLASGVDMLSALDSIQSGMQSQKVIKLMSEVRERVASGTPLSSAFAQSKLFAPRVLTLMRIGEESGRLVESFGLISDQEEKQRTLYSKVRSALLYPTLVFFVTLVVGVGVSWFILPRLARVFYQLHIELPLVTRAVLGFGSFLGEHGLWAVPLGIAILGLLFYGTFVHPQGRRLGEALLFNMPGVHTLIVEVELARLGYILGGLLRAGVPILEALDSLTEAAQWQRYKALYIHVRGRIEAGDPFLQSFSQYPGVGRLIPSTIQQLLATGANSGTLSSVLLKVGAVYEEKSDASTKNLSVILEPVLLVIVWLAVVMVALGVILHIYSIIGGVNR